MTELAAVTNVSGDLERQMVSRWGTRPESEVTPSWRPVTVYFSFISTQPRLKGTPKPGREEWGVDRRVREKPPLPGLSNKGVSWGQGTLVILLASLPPAPGNPVVRTSVWLLGGRLQPSWRGSLIAD